MPFCDRDDNLCKECLQDSHCTNGPANTVGTCVNDSCRYACDTQRGFRSCNGTCIGPNQCCVDTDCSNPCQACNTNTRTCGALGGRPDRCPGAQEVCNAAGQCAVPGLPNGNACNQNADCQSNDCRAWFRDSDGDGFGSQLPGDVLRLCGPNPPNVPGQVFVANDDDCCDSNVDVRPSQTTFFEEGYVCGGGLSFDYNCRNGEESTPIQACEDFGLSNCPQVVRVDDAGDGVCGGLVGGNSCGLIVPGGIMGTSCQPGDAGCACRGTRFFPIIRACR